MTSRQLDLIARAASYGAVDLEDLVPQTKRTARVSRSRIKRERGALERLNALEASGHMEGSPLNSRFVPTAKGIAALKNAGYAQNTVGYWLRDGAERPPWAS